MPPYRPIFFRSARQEIFRAFVGIHRRNQSGSALLVTLIFLVILTVLTIFGMRTSILELRMAGNSQYQMEALQAAQAALDDARGQVTNDKKLLPDNATVKTCTSPFPDVSCSKTITMTAEVVPSACISPICVVTVQISYSDQHNIYLPPGLATSCSGPANAVFYKINAAYSDSGQGVRANVGTGIAKIDCLSGS